MKFEQVCQTMNRYFVQKGIFRIALPISTPIMIVCVGLQLLNRLISLGGAMSTLAYIGALLSFVLVLSRCAFKVASLGMGAWALGYVYTFLHSLVKYHSINYSALIYTLLFGAFAYQAYKKSISINR